MTPNPHNWRHWRIFIRGPHSSLFENGKFTVDVFMTEQYPMKPPKMQFLNKVYHACVDPVGRVCVNVLKYQWTPALNMFRIAQELVSFLQNAHELASNEYNRYMDNKIAEVYQTNPQKAQRTATEWVLMYACEYVCDF